MASSDEDSDSLFEQIHISSPASSSKLSSPLERVSLSCQLMASSFSALISPDERTMKTCVFNTQNGTTADNGIPQIKCIQKSDSGNLEAVVISSDDESDELHCLKETSVFGDLSCDVSQEGEDDSKQESKDDGEEKSEDSGEQESKDCDEQQEQFEEASDSMLTLLVSAVNAMERDDAADGEGMPLSGDTGVTRQPDVAGITVGTSLQQNPFQFSPIKRKRVPYVCGGTSKELSVDFDRPPGGSGCPKRLIMHKDMEDRHEDFNFYGMGPDVRLAVFETFNLKSLLDWQHDFLKLYVIDNKCKRSALVLAPTSAGKTIVAVIMLLRAMIIDKKDVIFAVPYVAIVAEKVRELKLLGTRLNSFIVAEYAGRNGNYPVPKSKSGLRTLYVATTEKANGIWRSLCKEENRWQEIGLVVFDEFHMLGDGMRGTVIEELVVSLKYWSHGATRLMAMSATIGNPHTISDFLGSVSKEPCILYQVTSRPLPVKELMVVAGYSITIGRNQDGRAEINFLADKSNKMLQDNDKMANTKLTMFSNADDRIICKLVCESMEKKAPVLVFCNTRKSCVHLCKTLTEAYKATKGIPELDGDRDLQEQRKSLVGHLRQESKGMVDKVLLEGVLVGIGFHSAGLHPTERKAVEGAYSRGTLLTLCCTTTLASGVNLPTARIIIRSPSSYKNFISCASYMQMIGRAGRGLIVMEADAFIFLTPSEVALFEKLLQCHVEDVQSNLLKYSNYYKKQNNQSVNVDSPAGKPSFSGISRVVLSSLETANRLLTLTEVCEIYKLTLFYQSGERSKPQTGEEERSWTIVPLLEELQRLLRKGYVELVLPRPAPGVVHKETVIKVTESQPVKSDISTAPNSSDEELLVLTATETELVVAALEQACKEGTLTIKNYGLRPSNFAAAASAGAISLEDAAEFVMEADNLEKNLRMTDQLTFLYLSITPDMCKTLAENESPQAVAVTTSLIAETLGINYHQHPDVSVLEQLGLTEQKVNCWRLGYSAIRKDEKFCSSLTRMWSALFMRDLCTRPSDFEELCLVYGFDRGMALDLSANLASRCGNLRQFCRALGRYWWYPPLALTMMHFLTDAAEADVRALLVVRHVTMERAKALLKLGLRSVRDLATTDSPSVLTDKVKYLEKWAAAEMITDARMQLALEATDLDAESQELKLALANRRSLL